MILQRTPSGSEFSQLAVVSDGNAHQLIATIADANPSEGSSSAFPSTITDGMAYFMALCFLAAWAIALLAFLEGIVRYSKKATNPPCSQIPCGSCLFFSRNPHLRCAVHPSKALTKQAIDCTDYAFNPNPEQPGKKHHQF